MYVDSHQGLAYMTCDNTNPGLYNAFLVLDAGGGAVAFMASNGKYVTRQDAEGAPMICNRDIVAGWQRFVPIDNGDGTFSLQGDNGLFVSSENGQAPMTCNRSTIGGWEQFEYDLLPEDYKFDWLFNTAPTAPSPTTTQQATTATLPAPPPIPAETPMPTPAIAPPLTLTPAPTTPQVPTEAPTGVPISIPIVNKSPNYISLAALAGAMLIAVTGDTIIHHRSKLAFVGGIGLLYYLLNSQPTQTT